MAATVTRRQHRSLTVAARLARVSRREPNQINVPMSFRAKSKICALFLVWFLFADGVKSKAQTKESPVPPGVSLAHFARIDAGVYVGSKPRTKRDFQFLQSLHIRYIVTARFLPLFSGCEKRRAKQYGMVLLTFPMNASPIPPSEKHVDQILSTLRDPSRQLVYLHWFLGRDRTSLVAGLYKIRFLGVSKDQAWREMRQAGFPSWWFVLG